MQLKLDDKAAKWYIDEMHLEKGDAVRFFVRYGGCGTVQSGFSLGITKDTPDEIGMSQIYNEIQFFVEQKDLWYFDGHDLLVQFSETYKEPELKYVK